MGSNLWLWQRAQWTVRPVNVLITVVTMSSRSSTWRDAMVDGILAHTDHQRLVPGARGKEPERDRGLWLIGKKRVTGDLFLDESGIGLVFVERTDDVVAIGPGIGPGVVVVVAVRIGIVRQIQPVPSPVLAVTGRREQPRNERIISRGRMIRDKRVHSPPASAASRSGRNRAGGSRCDGPLAVRARACGGQLRANERVNRVGVPERNRGLHERLERPVALFRIAARACEAPRARPGPRRSTPGACRLPTW